MEDGSRVQKCFQAMLCPWQRLDALFGRVQISKGVEGASAVIRLAKSMFPKSIAPPRSGRDTKGPGQMCSLGPIGRIFDLRPLAL